MNDRCALEDTTAVILAGGLGTRLRHTCPDQQKVLVNVSGRPFVTYLLDHLTPHISRAVLCVGHLSEQVKELIGDTYNGLKLEYSEEQLLLGTGGALRLALPMIDSKTIVVMNGDSFCDVNLEEFFNWHQARAAMASIFLAEIDDIRRYGSVSTDNQDRITSFEEKGSVSGPGTINSGIYIFERTVIESIPKGRRVSLEREVFPSLIGSDFFGFRGSYSRFIDIGTPSALKEAEQIMGQECASL